MRNNDRDERMTQRNSLKDALKALIDSMPDATDDEIREMFKARFPEVYQQHRPQIFEAGLDAWINEHRE